MAASRKEKILRWSARIWSVLILISGLMMVIIPDPYATSEPIPAVDLFFLSLWGVAVLGLLIAWKWEFAGGIMTIATMSIRELAWVIIKGGWWVNFLVIWLFVVPPAIMFIIASRTAQKRINAISV